MSKSNEKFELFKKYCKDMKTQNEVLNQGQPSGISTIYENALKAFENFERQTKERTSK